MTAANGIQLLVALCSVAALVLAFRKGKRDDARTDADGLVARVARLERKARVLDDYCNRLRGDLRAAGLTVPDWPDELTEGGV